MTAMDSLVMESQDFHRGNEMNMRKWKKKEIQTTVMNT
jgi:hypothetical protein